ncbi:MAG: class IIb bacteriocin, lactobin A/cerein 7B family [bacterium]|nr:class IIb bacteriocin, lactobin A/cerein 7B family [bacterium]
MENLTDKQMMDIQGGGVNLGVIVGIAAGVTFIIGVIDGLIRPLKCN